MDGLLFWVLGLGWWFKGLVLGLDCLVVFYCFRRLLVGFVLLC